MLVPGRNSNYDPSAFRRSNESRGGGFQGECRAVTFFCYSLQGSVRKVDGAEPYGLWAAKWIKIMTL